VNFDEAKAKQEAMQRQRIAQAREAYAKQQADTQLVTEAEVEVEVDSTTTAADVAVEANEQTVN
jgi:hypothetical protein